LSILSTFIARGYLPKELPPAFSTEDLAAFCRTVAGRSALSSYKPAANFTECASYRLAFPGADGLGSRMLRIPHPYGYVRAAWVVAKNFRRLLKKAGTSPFSKSRPVYGPTQQRALRTLIRPANLAREKAIARAGSTHLLKVDVSQFYPSLYTHAVGWAIDPKLRQKKNWSNGKLLGKKIDQALMDLQGKVSHGIPIGNDVSFLLAELVLSQVDRSLKLSAGRACRWYDDYEIACSSRREAEETLFKLTRLLESFKLRLNPLKTKIVDLPVGAGDEWQDEILSLSRQPFKAPASMVAYFDRVLRLRALHPESPVLMYGIGVLFRTSKPAPEVHRVAQSYILQALLSEPGCAQKAFALLSFWEINGQAFDRELVARTVETLTTLHETRGLGSDLAWALAFAIQHRTTLNKKTGTLLSHLDDDAIALLALHANALTLLPGLKKQEIEKALVDETCDGPHWLALYESVAHGYFPNLEPTVKGNQFMAALLSAKVHFYRSRLPVYSMLIHPGGAPPWVLAAWAKGIPEGSSAPSVPAVIGADLAKITKKDKTAMEILFELFAKTSKDQGLALDLYS